MKTRLGAGAKYPFREMEPGDYIDAPGKNALLCDAAHAARSMAARTGYAWRFSSKLIAEGVVRVTLLERPDMDMHRDPDVRQWIPIEPPTPN